MLGLDWRWQIVITFVSVAWEIASFIVFIHLKKPAVLKPYFSYVCHKERSGYVRAFVRLRMYGVTNMRVGLFP
jgi:hypothetical protein